MRIPLLDGDEARAAAAEAGVPEYVTELNLNRVLLRHPGMGKRFNQFFTELMFKGRLDPRLRELAILRIAWLTGSAYEWTQHWHIAVGLGIPEADLLAARDPQAHAFAPVEQAVLAAVDDLVGSGVVSDPVWERLAAHLDDDQLVEVLLAVGWWRMVASVLETLAVPLEDGVDPWPPDGTGPA